MKFIVYGAGKYGRIVMKYYLAEGHTLLFFVETIKTKEIFEGVPVKELSAIDLIDKDVNVYVAMDEKNWDSVKNAIREKIPSIDSKRVRFIPSSEIKMYERIIHPFETDSFLNQTAPVDDNFGVGRGTPIDRYYIERFLEEQSTVIKKCNRTIEVGEDTYSKRYFPDAKHDILDHTLGMDLTKPGTIKDEAYDVFICTQTLHQIYEIEKAISGCYRLLKYGGTLLATVCGTITKLAHTDEYEHYWGFTELSIRNLMKKYFDNVSVLSYGNAMSATAFIQGIAVEEVNSDLLEIHDPDFPICISIVANK